MTGRSSMAIAGSRPRVGKQAVERQGTQSGRCRRLPLGDDRPPGIEAT